MAVTESYAAEHSTDCNYDADDDGANASFDPYCPGCRVHIADDLRCTCCDGRDGLGIWHFANVDALRTAIDSWDCSGDECDVEVNDPLGPMSFETIAEAELWLDGYDERQRARGDMAGLSWFAARVAAREAAGR